MDETLRQLGELLLRSIPTIVFFLVLFAAYRLLVHNPLEHVLKERHARTEADQHALFQSVAPRTEDGLYLVPRVIE